MRLRRLKLVNFRQYKHQEIVFPESGLIGIVGKNGAGKSTLFNAIGWCLYGTMKDVTSAMIKNQGSNKKDRYYVELDFEYKGKFYSVRRHEISSKCFVQEDGVTKATGATSLNQFIKDDLFKMDHKAFCTCYYAAQEDFDALAKLNPGPRVQTISKLLQIEAIDVAAEKTRKDYRMLESRVGEAKRYIQDQTEIEAEKEELIRAKQTEQERIAESNGLYLALEEGYKMLLLQKETSEKDYQDYQKWITEIKHVQETLEKEKKRIEPMLRELEVVKQIKEKLKELSFVKTDYEKLLEEKEQSLSRELRLKERNRILVEMERMKQEARRYLTEQEEIKEKLLNIGFIDINQREAELEKKQATFMLLRESYQELKSTFEQKKERHEELSSMKTVCPTCLQPLTKHSETEAKHIEEEKERLLQEAKDIQVNIKKVEQDAIAMKKEIEQSKQELALLREKEHQKTGFQKRLESVQDELAKRKERYVQLESEKNTIVDVDFDETKHHELMQQLARMEKQKEEVIRYEEAIKKIPVLEVSIEETRMDIHACEKRLLQAEREKENLHFDEVSYQNLKEKINEKTTEMKNEKEKQNRIQTELAVIESKEKALQSKWEENQKRIEQVALYTKEMTLLSKLDEVFKAYKIDKLSKLAPVLSDMMSQLMDTVTLGKYDRVDLDSDFSIHMYRNGIKNSLDFYSGGEQKLLALLQRLSISQLLVSQTGQASFDMLAMDEVFGSMDGERQDSLMEMLRHLNDIFPQILIVTHDEQVKDGFDYTLEIKVSKEHDSQIRWDTVWDETSIREKIKAYETVMEEEEDVS